MARCPQRRKTRWNLVIKSSKFASGRGLRVMASQQHVTQVLAQLREGDSQAASQLLPLVYDELRRLAGRYLQNEAAGHTLQPTALVHEAYLRLVDQTDADWRNRAHFFAVAAQAMRNILVDHARSRRAAKRGGDRLKLPLDEAGILLVGADEYLVALDEAMRKLELLDVQQSRIVELRFFAGLTIEETAEVLRISPKTVQRDWLMARAWLHREITKGD
jgi:RNA polymerase sigma-70 factor (ECF subfamily)